MIVGTTKYIKVKGDPKPYGFEVLHEVPNIDVVYCKCTTHKSSSRNISMRRFENEYYDTPEEAIHAYYMSIETKTLDEIDALQKQIKQKEDIIAQAKREVDYDVLKETHPDLFI